MRELFAEITSSLSQGRSCVYCTVVETRGSTPQKAGAAMVVHPDGRQQGTLGGGCVEAEVRQRALQLLVDGGKPEVRTFHLDDNYGWDDGLICGGRMTMLIEPLTPGSDAGSYCVRYLELLQTGQGFTEAIGFRVDDTTAVTGRILFDHLGTPVSQLRAGSLIEAVQRNLPPLATRPRPTTHQSFAYLPTLPNITLLIVGAGHVGRAVARLAAEADFEVCVVDDRETFANRERFPAAKRLEVGDIGNILKQMGTQEITPSWYCLIVTRGHHHDEEALYHLATSQAGYVGMIGSKRKIRLIFEDLVAKGIPTQALERVHAPLGFDIGSQTVPEIAISIVAELIACRNLEGVSKRTKSGGCIERSECCDS